MIWTKLAMAKTTTNKVGRRLPNPPRHKPVQPPRQRPLLHSVTRIGTYCQTFFRLGTRPNLPCPSFWKSRRTHFWLNQGQPHFTVEWPTRWEFISNATQRLSSPRAEKITWSQRRVSVTPRPRLTFIAIRLRSTFPNSTAPVSPSLPRVPSSPNTPWSPMLVRIFIFIFLKSFVYILWWGAGQNDSTILLIDTQSQQKFWYQLTIWGNFNANESVATRLSSIFRPWKALSFE